MSAPDSTFPKSAPKSTHEGDSPRRSGGSSTRLIVLLLILFVAAAAAGWDYLVSRPGYEQALEKVKPLLPFSDEGGDAGADPPAPQKTATQEDVHAVLDVEPVVTESAGSYLIERYSWRRGLPWMTYDLWVVYDDDDGRTLRNATSVRTEADLYYATARRPDPPAENSEPESQSATDASAAPAGDSSEPSSDAKTETADPPADESPEPAADETPDGPAEDS